jgi:tetratricopeptide (TPR) repeat protein
VGTSFSVDVPDPSGPVRVRVEEGIVAVAAPGGPVVRVQAGEETVMGTSVVTPSASASAERSPAVPPLPSAVAAPSSPSAPTVPRSSVLPPPRVASADALLQRARTLRGAGRFREAANAYEELEAAHPESPEARASLVSLGEVELSQLGDPARALRAFDEYLTLGGGLAEEAAYDRILALAALGRAGEERAASESFISRYPTSLHTPGLQSRLRRGDAAP